MDAWPEPMQGSFLVKPNLKLILLGALLIAVLHDVFTSGKSEQSSFYDQHYRASWLSDGELVELVEQVNNSPNSDGYMMISNAYHKRGDIRKAMYYIRKAELVARLGDTED